MNKFRQLSIVNFVACGLFLLSACAPSESEKREIAKQLETRVDVAHFRAINEEEQFYSIEILQKVIFLMETHKNDKFPLEPIDPLPDKQKMNLVEDYLIEKSARILYNICIVPLSKSSFNETLERIKSVAKALEKTNENN